MSYSKFKLRNNIIILPPEVSIGPRHPEWIGAWWLGFLVFGTLALFIGLPLLLFPRRMKSRNVAVLCKEENIAGAAGVVGE